MNSLRLEPPSFRFNFGTKSEDPDSKQSTNFGSKIDINIPLKNKPTDSDKKEPQKWISKAPPKDEGPVATSWGASSWPKAKSSSDSDDEASTIESKSVPIKNQPKNSSLQSCSDFRSIMKLAKTETSNMIDTIFVDEEVPRSKKNEFSKAVLDLVEKVAKQKVDTYQSQQKSTASKPKNKKQTLMMLYCKSLLAQERFQNAYQKYLNQYYESQKAAQMEQASKNQEKMKEAMAIQQEQQKKYQELYIAMMQEYQKQYSQQQMKMMEYQKELAIMRQKQMEESQKSYIEQQKQWQEASQKQWNEQQKQIQEYQKKWQEARQKQMEEYAKKFAEEQKKVEERRKQMMNSQQMQMMNPQQMQMMNAPQMQTMNPQQMQMMNPQHMQMMNAPASAKPATTNANVSTWGKC